MKLDMRSNSENTVAGIQNHRGRTRDERTGAEHHRNHGPGPATPSRCGDSRNPKRSPTPAAPSNDFKGEALHHLAGSTRTAPPASWMIEFDPERGT